MPRLNSFRLNIETGEQGLNEKVQGKFNGHQFEPTTTEQSQGTESGQQWEGEFSPMSYVHTFTLLGPESGQWDIKRLTVEFHQDGEDPWSISMGPVTLDDETELNLWKPKPLPVYEV